MRLKDYLLNEKKHPYFYLGCILLAYILLSQYETILNIITGVLRFFSPVLEGLVMAFILDMFSNFYQNRLLSRINIKRGKRVISIWLGIVSIVGILVIVSIYLIPQLVQSIVSLMSGMEIYIQNITDMINAYIKATRLKTGDVSVKTEIPQTFLNNLIKNLPWKNEEGIAQIIDKSAGVSKSVADTVISFVIAIYLVLDKDKFKLKWSLITELLIGRKRYRAVRNITRKCIKVFSHYIIGDLLDSIIVGLSTFIFVSFLHMQYGLLISVVVGLTNLAPTFGPIVGALSGGLILLVTDPWHALFFLVFTAILQFLDAFIIKPKLFGNAFDISPLWILVTIVLLGRAFGIVGVFVAIPVAALIDIFFKDALLYFMQVEEPEDDPSE